MKHISVIGLVVVLFVSMFVASPVFAGLSNNINLPGLNFSMGSYQQWDGDMTFAASLTTLDQISYASVGVSQDMFNLNQGWVSINFSGTVGLPVVRKDWESLSFSLNCRGVHASSTIGIGSYHDIIDWIYPIDGDEGTLVYGDWMSNSNGSITLSGATLLFATGGYDEYTYNNGGKGDEGIGNLVTNFNAWAQFHVQFISPEIAAVYSGMSPIQMSAVPEPATLAILGLGGLLLRHRRSSK